MKNFISISKRFDVSKVCYKWHVALLFFLFVESVFAQVNGLENFENEIPASGVFSENGINFNTSFLIVSYPGNFGYMNSPNFLERKLGTGVNTSTATISLNTSTNPGIAFKINFFAAYTSSANTGNVPYNGQVVVKGTPVGGSSELTATININSATGASEGNGMVHNLHFDGTPLMGLYFTQLSFTITDQDPISGTIGTRYIGIDHISFTTQVPVTNNYAISNVSIVEGNSGSSTLTYNVNRSIATNAGSVQIQSSNGTATSGSDYTAVPLTTVNFAAGGPLTQTVSVTILGDNTIEPNETFNMTLSNPVGGTIATGTGIVTITDDDQYTEPFEDEVHNATTFSQNGVSFQTTGKLQVKISGGFGAGGSTGYASSKEPFATGAQGSFQITSPGKSFYVTSVDLWSAVVSGTSPNWVYTPTACTVTFTGTKFDGSGTVTHSMAINPSGTNVYSTVNFAGTPLANINLSSLAFSVPSPISYLSIDNFKYGVTGSSVTQVSINDVSVQEGTGGGALNTATFTVTRTNNIGNFTVDVFSSALTASEGTDYTAFPTTILSFTAGGALSQTVTVPILKDDAVEANETFEMRLINLSPGVLYLKQVGVGTILDDDRICETFDTDTHNATTFSENGVSFSVTNRFRVANSGNSNGQGSGNSPGFLIATNGAIGSMGKIVLSSANRAIKLSSIDAWVSTDGTNGTSGSITFIATLFGGGTVSVTKAISPNGVGGWMQNVTFTGTALDNVLITEIEVVSISPITEVDLDNFCFAIFNTQPYIEVFDNGTTAVSDNGTPINFGTQCTGYGFSAKNLTIKNTGFVNLVLSGSPLAVLAGTHANQYTIGTLSSATIAPGSSLSLPVTFDPDTGGPKNATVTFTSNDTTNPSFVVNMTGNAVAPAGNPTVFGTDTWNIFAWNSGSGIFNGWDSNYSGYYSNSNLNIQTTADWNNLLSPSAAVNYQGCPVNVDLHSFSAKRKGFPCALYQIDVVNHDDAAQLFINGQLIWEHNGCCDSHLNVWTGFLGPSDFAEFRVSEGGGASLAAVNFITLASTPAASTTNNGLAFDGINDFVQVANCNSQPFINGGSAITIEYWFKGSYPHSPVRIQDGGDNYIVAGWNGLHILSNDGGINAGLSIGGAAVSDGNWHHLAFTWQQGATNGFRSFLDGQLVAQRNAANTPLPIINYPLLLGSYLGVSEFMNGTLDEVRIWNVARTQPQIQAGMVDFCKQFPLPQAGLVLYYKFDVGQPGQPNAANILQNYANPSNHLGLLKNFALTSNASNYIDGTFQNVEWTGAANTDWNNKANWACEQRPNFNSSVTIPGGKSNYPAQNISGTIKKLSVLTGGTITMPAASLIIRE